MNRPNPHRRPDSRRALPVRGGADRYEALLQVLEQQAERAAGDEPWRGRSVRSFQGFALVVLFVIAAWLWVLPPRSLVPAPAGPGAIEQEEASLRMAMYLQAQRIEAYRLEHGRLPEALSQAGGAIPGIRYMVLEDGVYELLGEVSRLRLSYRSDQPLFEWVGAGADLLDPIPR